MLRILGLALMTMGALCSCTITRQTEPARTATEQLLVSAAADRGAESLKLDLPPGTKVFLDTQYFDAGDQKGADQKYAIGAIKDRLLKQQLRMVADKGNADAIVEIRAGALSIDHDKMLIGIPGFNIPIPFAGGLPFPEIALYENDRQRGIAKFAATGYGAKSGELEASAEPVFGVSHRTHKIVLFFFASTTNDIMPGEGTK